MKNRQFSFQQKDVIIIICMKNSEVTVKRNHLTKAHYPNYCFYFTVKLFLNLQQLRINIKEFEIKTKLLSLIFGGKR